MTSNNKPDSNIYAIERTHMAAERTFYSVLRTGLAIAGAGTVVVAILGESWEEYERQGDQRERQRTQRDPAPAARERLHTRARHRQVIGPMEDTHEID